MGTQQHGDRCLSMLKVLVALPFIISCTHKEQTVEQASDVKAAGQVLFEDALAANWQANWFLDGKKATLEHRDGGLYYAAGSVTKYQDRDEYHAHHAVLWTKQSFEGDIKISFECKRIDDSDYGNILIYIQAQGIGVPPYVNDIHAWKEMRDIPAMAQYFKYMSLLSISLRPELRCKRYPWQDVEKGISFDPLIKPMQDWHGMTRGRWFRFEIEKRLHSLTFKSYDRDSGELLKTCTWDTTKNPEGQMPRLIEKGRIGVRQMSTKQTLYRDLKVSRL